MLRFSALTVVASIALLSSCGGGDSGPSEPPDTTPASIEITAGHQQSADGGAPLAISPAVRVRDGDGNPVSGASVTFQVEAGGGSIAGSPATTNSQGVATAGQWTLGPAGVQRLSARVGSVTPVIFEATITPGTEQLVVQIGAAGGSFEIDEAGHPFEGLELNVPVGAYNGAVEWRFRPAPAPAGLDLPNGYSIQGPALEVQTNAGRGGALTTVRVPVSRGPDNDVVIAFYDADRDVIEVLPTVNRSDTWVEAVTTHLNAGLLLGPGDGLLEAASAPAQQVNIGGPVGHLVRIALDLPIADATGTVNRWPVIEHGSFAFPEGHGAAIPLLELIGSNQGPLFPLFADIVRPLNVPGFYAEAGPLAGIQLMHDRLANPMGTFVQQLDALMAELPKAERDEVTNHNVAASIALSGKASMVALSNTLGRLHFAMSSHAGDRNVGVRLPSAETVAVLTRVIETGFENLQVSATADGPPEDVNKLFNLPALVLPLNQVADLVQSISRLGDALSDEERAAINEALAAQADMPQLELEEKNLDGDDWRPITGDVVAWSPRTSIRIGGGMFGSFTIHLPAGPQVGQANGAFIMETLSDFADMSPLGHVFRVFSINQMVGGSLKQVAPFSRRTVRAPFEVEPEEVTLDTPADPVEFEASVPPMLSGFRIEWDWGDGETTENLGLLNASHSYDEGGVYEVVASLKPANVDFTLAKDTVQVVIGASPNWHADTSARTFALVASSPPGVMAFRNVVTQATTTDLFIVPRPAGAGSEQVVLILVAPGTGATLEEPPTAAGPGGFELVVATVPAGTLAAGTAPINGAGGFTYQGSGHSFTFSATFSNGVMSGEWRTTSNEVEPDFGNPYFRINPWSFSASRFTPPEPEEEEEGGP